MGKVYTIQYEVLTSQNIITSNAISHNIIMNILNKTHP
jgi:hypothetical protein